ncbi:prostatic acid phosphatase-like [Paramacrobiotus metropolitanus]|uniref:prostatic acid phosphatase-like n=1 Tax=Paramacrobiotus metropolitanus TaxID=2943436 RepID=UPI00244640EF|nr:prostatic acid phosphatase-like [Paramacrobiotus metropolitanus]
MYAVVCFLVLAAVKWAACQNTDQYNQYTQSLFPDGSSGGTYAPYIETTAYSSASYSDYTVPTTGVNVADVERADVRIQNDSLPISNTEASVSLDELLLVQVVHRHGERTSLFQIPTAGEVQRQNSPSIEAQLTSNGIRQMYEYGQFIRTRYHAFFEDGERASSQRIKVISSATDRTIKSAQALIAGLLPPNGTRRQWNTPLGEYWNPFPVYTRPRHHDALLLNYDMDCPEFAKLRNSIGELPAAKLLQNELQGFKENVIKATDVMEYNFFETTTRIHDALLHQQRYANDSSYPKWMNQSLYDTMDRIVNMRMHLIAGGNRDRVRTRFRVGHLLKEIVDRMNTAGQAYKTGKSNELKMVLYSGHDENVAGILAALDLFNYTVAGPNFGVPKFTASIIFEYFRNNTVRVLFKNDPDNMAADPKILDPPHCGIYCPLDAFTDQIRDLDGWEKRSGKKNAGCVIGLPESIIIAGVLVAFCLLLLVAAIVGVCHWRMRRVTYHQASPVFAQPLRSSAPKDVENAPPSPLVYVRPSQKLLNAVENGVHDSRL